MKNHQLISLFLIILLVSCNRLKEEKNGPIINKKDYVQFLEQNLTHRQEAVKKTDIEIRFWKNKLNIQPNSFLYMQKLAGLYQGRFELSGEINDLNQAHNYLKEVNNWVRGKHKLNNMFALAGNAITLHQFDLAKNYGQQALNLNKKIDKSWYVLFDSYMELGEYTKASEIIDYSKEYDDFDYLVRASKYMDFLGKSDSSILLMEKAETLIDKHNATSLKPWIKTYLGDMYGHSGDLNKSYQYYLQALKNDPFSDHAFMGIAKIAYSNDLNINAAIEILESIYTAKKDPGALWLMAEIAIYSGETKKAKKILDQFKAEVTNQEYGGMYNRYLALAEAEFYKNYPIALKLAKKEVNDRPTLESYDLLSWIYFQKGDYQKALEIVNNQLKDRSSEPMILYHSGMIFQANSHNSLAKKYLKEAWEGAFELGPVISRKIKDAYHYL